MTFISVVGKLKTVRVDEVKSSSMLVRWRLDCTDRVGIVTGYRVAFCAIKSDKDTADCMDGKQGSVEVGPDTDHIWVEDLSPWTFYKVIYLCLQKHCQQRSIQV